MIVSDWQVLIGMTLYISSTAQHFSYSAQLPTQLNYWRNKWNSSPPNEEQDPWLSMDTSTPSTEEAERGILMEMYQQTVQGKSCYH